MTSRVLSVVAVLIVTLISCNIVAFKLFVIDAETNTNNDNHLRKSFHLKKSSLNDETNVKIPTDKYGNQMSIEERLRYLELKMNAFMNFGSDPFFGVKVHRDICKKSTSLEEFGCKIGWEGVEGVKGKTPTCPGLFDHDICIDELPAPGTKYNLGEGNPPCLVYDFGIRAQPQFGAVMARTFGCEVHGFDPSPVSTEWWNSKGAKELRKLPNYHFHPYGGGGIDGVVKLKEYNWGQVSILHYPSMYVECEGKDTICRITPHHSKTFKLPVKTLPTIMKELGHEGRTIDVLKVDIEGSEYAFLEQLLDASGGCPDFIKQITLEWHHFSFDSRYGEGATPSINAIVTLLNTCGLKNIWQYCEGGWPSNERIYQDLKMPDVRYNLATFYRESDNKIEEMN